MNNNERLAAVYQATGEAEAHIIKGLLESNGIPCLLKSSEPPGLVRYALFGIGRFDVMVRESLADEARKLIARENNV